MNRMPGSSERCYLVSTCSLTFCHVDFQPTGRKQTQNRLTSLERLQRKMCWRVLVLTFLIGFSIIGVTACGKLFSFLHVEESPNPQFYSFGGKKKKNKVFSWSCVWEQKVERWEASKPDRYSIPDFRQQLFAINPQGVNACVRARVDTGSLG